MIKCPHCQNTMDLKGAKPGRYAPKCKKCGQRFMLIIPAEPGAPPQVSKISDPVSKGGKSSAAPTASPTLRDPEEAGSYDFAPQAPSASAAPTLRDPDQSDSYDLGPIKAPPPEQPPSASRLMAHELLADTGNPKHKREQDRLKAAQAFGGPIGLLLLGPRARFLVGAALVALCCAWLSQNNLFTAAKWTQFAKEAFDTTDYSKPGENPTTTTATTAPLIHIDVSKPLSLSFIPDSIATNFLSSPVVGIAGILLLLSALRPGAKTAVFMFPAVLILIAGPPFGTNVLGLPHHGWFNAGLLSATLGTLIAILGYLFGKEMW